jgi:hypothetical protein
LNPAAGQENSALTRHGWALVSRHPSSSVEGRAGSFCPAIGVSVLNQIRCPRLPQAHAGGARLGWRSPAPPAQWFSREPRSRCARSPYFSSFCIDVLAPATRETAAGREFASQHEVNERLKVRRRGGAGGRPVVVACSWSSVHQHVPTDAEHHSRHHHQHSQRCAHHRFLNSSVSLLSNAGS